AWSRTWSPPRSWSSATAGCGATGTTAIAGSRSRPPASTRESDGRAGVGDPLRRLDVPVHLLHELVHRVEPLLAAQPLQERDAERLAVDVGVEADQVGLDQEAAAGLECRAHAHVDGGR